MDIVLDSYFQKEDSSYNKLVMESVENCIHLRVDYPRIRLNVCIRIGMTIFYWIQILHPLVHPTIVFTYPARKFIGKKHWLL